MMVKMTNTILFKRLGGEDAGLMAGLNSLFSEVFEDAENYSSHKPSAEYLQKWLVDSNNIALVAIDNNIVVGGLAAYTLHKFEQDRSEVYIYDLAVSKDYQRMGIATSLINELRTVAEAQNSYVIFVQADEGDEAVEFYESLHPSENIKTRNFDFSIDN